MSNKYIIDDALNYLSTANNFNRRVNGKAVVENVPPYDTLTLEEVVDLLNSLSEENERLRHWNKCLAEKRHNENETEGNLIKKLLSKINFLERIIDGDL